MGVTKIIISMDEKVLAGLDRMVKAHAFPNRSKAIESAVRQKLKQMEYGHLARECAKLDPEFEKAMAEEGF